MRIGASGHVPENVKKIRSTAWSADLQRTADTVAAQIDGHLALPAGKTDGIGFQDVVDKVFALFGAPGSDTTEEGMHRLGNLALLQRDFNSKLNNAVFALKRERILELDGKGPSLHPALHSQRLPQVLHGRRRPAAVLLGDRIQLCIRLVRALHEAGL